MAYRCAANCTTLIGNAICITHSNETEIESFGFNNFDEDSGMYCTIRSNDFGNKSMIETLASSDILVIGDSHAHRQFYAINYAIQGVFRFRTLNLFGRVMCGYVFELIDHPMCSYVHKLGRKMMMKMQPNYVFFHGFMDYYISQYIKHQAQFKVCFEK